jgi:hypothetical protein
MTLELLTVNHISAPGFPPVQHQPTPADHMGKDFLSEFNVLLTTYQSDFPWR